MRGDVSFRAERNAVETHSAAEGHAVQSGLESDVASLGSRTIRTPGELHRDKTSSKIAFIALLDTSGERREARRIGRSPLYISGFGAQVARQRCPILRAAKPSLPRTTRHIKLPAGIHKAINASR
jgi:hypothetical protein